jgi:hypothetical protein
VVGHSVYSTNNAKYLVGPRAGIAWAPSRKTAIHVGYGIYYEQLDYMGACCDSTPNGAFNNRVAVSPATFPLLLAAGQTYPGSKIGPNGVQSDLQMPTMQHYSLRIDQSISANTILSAGYVGASGKHLLSSADVNTAIPTMVNGSPYYAPKSPRANPALSNSRINVSNASSNYNSMQIDLTHRYHSGFQFRVNYAYSKSLDDHSASFVANEGLGGTTTYLDARNPMLDWGRSNFDITHRISGHMGYELPFGKGRPLLANANRAANAIFGGWQVNAIFAAQTGFPFTPLVGFNQSADGNSRNPDRVSINPNFSGNIVQNNPNQWFNPQAFWLPAAGTYGDAGRDIIEAPGILSLDASLFKTVRVGERMTLQLRGEFFNALNHANFGWPVIGTFTTNGAYSSSAGVITNTIGTSRQIQVALKLGW